MKAFRWRDAIDDAGVVAPLARADKGSFSSSFSDTGSVHGQGVQGVAATRAVIAKPAVSAVVDEGANRHRQEPKPVVAPPVLEGPIHDGRAVVAEGANRHRQEPKPVVAPSGLEGHIHDGRLSGLRGTIVNINHAKQFAFIRSPQFSTDFFVGRQHFRPQMAMGDMVLFRGHPEVKQRGGRCPDAADVALVARENLQTRQVDPLPLFGAWANTLLV